jgi:hypothetical protein
LAERGRGAEHDEVGLGDCSAISARGSPADAEPRLEVALGRELVARLEAAVEDQALEVGRQLLEQLAPLDPHMSYH